MSLSGGLYSHSQHVYRKILRYLLRLKKKKNSVIKGILKLMSRVFSKALNQF